MTWLAPLQQLLDLVYPRECACGTVCHAPATYVCPSCLDAFWPTGHADNLVLNTLYARLPEDLPLTGAYAGWVFRKDTAIQAHLHAIKYRRAARAARQLGYLCGLQLRGKVPTHYVVVPVPLHPRKRLKRGFNQAEWVARGIAEGAGLPMDTRLAYRRVNTRSQTRLSRAERQTNVADVFGLRKPAPTALLLVDDVITTGATLASLARTCLAAGTTEVMLAGLVMADD